MSARAPKTLGPRRILAPGEPVKRISEVFPLLNALTRRRLPRNCRAPIFRRMSRHTLRKAVELAGGQTALATKLGTRQSTVNSWLRRGRGIPADQVLDVAEAIDYQLTPHELRPDVYPYADDGLPPIFRRKVS